MQAANHAAFLAESRSFLTRNRNVRYGRIFRGRKYRTKYEYDPVTEQQTHVWTGTNSASPTTDTQYVYDTLGRLDQVEEHWRFGTQLDADATADGYQPEVTDYVYDLSGNLAQTRFAGDVVTDYQYDALNRLDLMRNYVDDGDNVYELADDTLLSEFDYTVRADGKRTAVVEQVYNGTATKTTEVDWLYDDIGRLVAEVYDDDASVDGDALDFMDRYQFDLVGNRLGKERDEAATDAAISAFLSSGTLTSDLDIDYTYDANDRLLTEKNDASGTADDRFTVYGYDVTQQTSEMVHVGLDDTGVTVEQKDYSYNLQGRMAMAEVSQYDSSGQTLQSHTKSSYEYDDSGIRVAQTQQVDVNNDGDFDDAEDTTERTDYHVDHRNPTGYAQVLEEMQGAAVVKSYTIGHDVFLEAVAANQVRHLLKDGHGSTRQLVDATGAVINSGTAQVFAYDAYGNPHGFTLANALTTHLYSGEQTDQLTGLQYLRARYYNPATGTFNRLDPFTGNFSDPQSLHKYLYTHGNPITGLDPTGLFFLDLGGLATQAYVAVKAASAALNTYSGIQGFLHGIEAMYSGDLLGATLNFGLGAMNLGFAALDVFGPFTPPPAGGLGMGVAVAAGGSGRLTGRYFGQLVLHAPGMATWLYNTMMPALVRTAAGAVGLMYANNYQEVRSGTDNTRSTSGVAHGGENLPDVGPGNQWLENGMGLVPGEVASTLRGRWFANWDAFREAFWKAVYDIPHLRNQFTTEGSLAEMARGHAPFAPRSMCNGARVKFEIDHMEPLIIGWERILYDLDNLLILPPRYHTYLHSAATTLPPL